VDALNKKKIIKYVCLAVGIILLASLLLVIIVNIDLRGDIRYHRTMMGISATTLSRMLSETDFGYFEDIESAIVGYFEEGPPREVVRFEEEDYLLVIFPGDVLGPFFERYTPIIHMYLFMKQENGMLKQIHAFPQGIESLGHDTRGNWYDEDRIARDIVYAHVQSGITARVNNGVPLLYGVGVGHPPAYMSILGYEPDVIIPFTYRDADYFFWYYRTMPQFGEILSANIDISDMFTFGEVIELFDIQVQR